MKYRNKSNQRQELIGFGVVEAGGIVRTKKRINNPNFELVEEAKSKKDKK